MGLMEEALVVGAHLPHRGERRGICSLNAHAKAGEAGKARGVLTISLG